MGAGCGCGWSARPAITCASLADALGERLGHRARIWRALVRTRSGDFTLEHAVGLDVSGQPPSEAAAHSRPAGRSAAGAAGRHADAGGRSLAARGGFIGPAHVSGDQAPAASPAGCGCCTPTAAWSPSPSPREREGGCSRFLHPGVVLE